MLLSSITAAAAALFFTDHVLSTPNPSPKVVGYTFEKRVSQATKEGRLHRRQKTVSVDIDNQDIAYLINVTIGTPDQHFSLQLDTGSSDIWIPAADSNACREVPDACQAFGAYDPERSSTFSDVAQDAFQISYEDNSQISGDYINETLKVGGITIQNMTMGLATQATRAFGIAGIGYDADEAVADMDSNAIYPNLISQLKDQGFTNTLAYSLWLNDQDSLTGSILFGGVDTAKFSGSLIVLPIQSSDNQTYTDFTVVLSSITITDASGKKPYDQSNLALPAILDSGTTATYVPDDLLNPIISGIGAVNDPVYGGLTLPCSYGSSKATFTFGFGGPGGPSIEVPLSSFVNDLFLEDGSQPHYRHSSDLICQLGLQSSSGGPILFGDTFLRNAYVVYDLENNQIGMAPTKFNVSDTSVTEISSSGIPGATTTVSGAMVTQTYQGHPQETQDATISAGPEATGGRGTPTFNLGLSSATGKSAAAAVTTPKVDILGSVLIGVTVLLSLMGGGGLIAMI